VDDLIPSLPWRQRDGGGGNVDGWLHALRALERHRRFRAAVLCNTKSEPTATRKIMRARTMAAVKSRGSLWFAEDFIKKVFAPESFTRLPDAVEMIRTTIAHTPPLAIAGMLLALAARTDTTPSLPDIAVATLILVGEHDTTTPPEASKLMHERIRGSVLHIIPRAAHMSPLENPVEVNAHLREFLAALPPLS
jgi:pimeloyl-ACP methyl ester carboxylesterase